MKKPTTLRGALKGKLTEKEFSYLRAAFDLVGDIAIIEIPDELVKKEKIIADALLVLLKNVKVVCKKAGMHEGVFRTQKMKVLAGENRKETVHKENDVRVKIDVEKVYFSSRLSTERKRIYEQIKAGEDVLVMFSGCGIYPLVIAKNSKAKFVYGIEINPDAHRCGMESVRLNKLANVFLINDDVKKAVPVFYQKMIGLKSAVIKDEMASRLECNPSIIEIHTFESDFDVNFEDLRKDVKEFVDSGMFVVVHQPHIFSPGLDMANTNIKNEIYRKMVSLVDEFGVELIVHFSMGASQGAEKKDVIANAKTFKKYYKNIYFEHSHRNLIKTKEEIIDVVKAAGIRNVCIDTCHLLHNYSPDSMAKAIEDIQKYCNTYFHISDYKNDVHGSRINEKSVIKLEKILPLVTKGIVEIRSIDEIKAEEMISSWKYLKKFKKCFDRIVMPLPKSAEDFLDCALACSKKKSVIHFYDFLNEKEFGKAHDKINEACKRNKMKFKILRTVKCGQFSPGVFRICVDFRID
ncbi:MAG: hypothetical protein QF362_00275 [Candidatus Woesearchaeota archaeon]|jgi:tRNA G37 N-methylase Trm5|nr:hypothetical protein [Candidatus Woesearchaeota archaeon]MDP7505865.1 hypothetical protein [Candidatus Woesearchaeota archaeon]|tara:strand:- start:1148 stop:2707 length:1560 start_codon:yes stop_codon:yes gene_type:complete